MRRCVCLCVCVGGWVRTLSLLYMDVILCEHIKTLDIAFMLWRITIDIVTMANGYNDDSALTKLVRFLFCMKRIML